jgi:putative transposase
MDGSLRLRAEQLANEFAGQATRAEEISGLMRLMMKSALERMLNTELDVHLGRRAPVSSVEAGRPPEEAPPAIDPAASGDASQAGSEPSQRTLAKNGPRRPGRTNHRHASRS